MQPHNVDIKTQQLSLSLGVGILASKESRYKSEKDIFEDIEWGDAI